MTQLGEPLHFDNHEPRMRVGLRPLFQVFERFEQDRLAQRQQRQVRYPSDDRDFDEDGSIVSGHPGIETPSYVWRKFSPFCWAWSASRG